jgi:hypothetical protein
MIENPEASFVKLLIETEDPQVSCASRDKKEPSLTAE